METPNTPRRRGRPFIAPPVGRDLAQELAQLKSFLDSRPLLKPGTISVAAGLHRAALGHVLRGYRSPQADALDAVYKVLESEGYSPAIAN